MNPQNPYAIGFSPYSVQQNTENTPSNTATANTGFFGGGYSPYSQLSLLPTIPLSGGPQGGFFGLPALPVRRPENPQTRTPDYQTIDPVTPQGNVFTPTPLPDLTGYPPQVRDAIELERQRDLGLAPRPSPPPGLPDFSDTIVDMPKVDFNAPPDMTDTIVDMPRVDLNAPPQPAMTPQEILQMAVGRIPADLRYDANGDGRITSADALIYQKSLLGYPAPNPTPNPTPEPPPRLSAQEQAQQILKMAVQSIPADLQYDLNGDGRITSADALAYLKQHTR